MSHNTSFKGKRAIDIQSTTRSGGEPMGRKRPYDHEMEKVVLGALMLDRNALADVADILRPTSFDNEKHVNVFKAIVTLVNRSEAVDIMTVSAEMRKQGTLEISGGAFYISELTNRVNSTANIVYHARILLQFAIKREMINIANRSSETAYDETSDAFEVLDSMEQSLFAVSEMNIRKNYEKISVVAKEVIKELEMGGAANQNGVPSGFTLLDKETNGWQPAELIIVAARPAMGKTAFVLCAARNAAIDHGKPVAFFSLEMSRKLLVKRMYSAETGIPAKAFKNADLTKSQWANLVANTAKVNDASIYIDETAALSVLELRAKCRRLKAQHGIGLIIIDYLQLMTIDASVKMINREQEISFISRSLKQLSKELDVPVIALSQLSRAVETRGGAKRPMLSDLRESGSIEQDADMVLFLYRPEYYGITETEDGESTKNLAEVIIAKHRNGDTGNVKLKFINELTKFENFGYEEGSVSGNNQRPHMTLHRTSNATTNLLSNIPQNNPDGLTPPF